MGQVLRRKRGTGVGNVQVNYTIPPRCKATLEDAAGRMQMSASEALELVLDNIQFAEDGLPVWFDQEGLPLAKAS